MSFGSWLKQARAERGLSLRQLARRANNVCTFGYIAQLEHETRGKKGQEMRPDLEIVDALAIALDKPINDARSAAGYAPLSATPQEPQTARELIDRLWELGIHIEFADIDIDSGDPETLERVKGVIAAVVKASLPKMK